MHDELERFIAKALRDQPPLTAPASLEARVLAALAQVKPLPWWQRGFRHWPVFARLAFLVASIGFVRVGLLAWDRVTTTVGNVDQDSVAIIAPGLSWATTVADLAAAFNEVFRAVLAGIPAGWLYLGGATLLSLYALFFGLGVIGYRTFRTRH
jgi:hypothetical protein